MRRPLGVIGFSYFIALGVAFCFSPNTWVYLTVISSVFALLGLAFLKGQSKIVGVALAAFCVGVLMYQHTYNNRYLPAQSLAGKEIPVTVQIKTQPQFFDWGTNAKCKILNETIGDIKGEFDIQMTFWEGADIHIGDVFTAVVKFEQNYVSPTGTNFALANGCYLSGTVSDPNSIFELPFAENFSSAFHRMRQQFITKIFAYIPGQASAMVQAVCFGVKTDLSEEIVEAFRVCGISHLLALSGLHLGVVVSLVYYLLKKLGVNPFATGIISSIFALLFACVVGFSPSVCRALIIVCYTAVAKLFYRDVEPVTVLGFACLVLTAHNPFAILNVGLVLSLLACFGAIVVYPSVTRYLKEQKNYSIHPFWQSLIFTLCVLYTTFSYSGITFGFVSLAGIVCNLIYVPIFSLIVSWGISGTLLCSLPVIGFVFRPILAILGLFVDNVLETLPFVSKYASYLLVYPSVLQCVLFFAGAIVICALTIIPKLPHKGLVFSIGNAALVLSLWLLL